MSFFTRLTVQDPKYRSRKTTKLISHRRILVFQTALIPLFSAIPPSKSLNEPSDRLILKHLLLGDMRQSGSFSAELVWNIFNEMETLVHLVDATCMEAITVFNTLYDLFGEAACMGTHLSFDSVASAHA